MGDHLQEPKPQRRSSRDASGSASGSEEFDLEAGAGPTSSAMAMIHKMVKHEDKGFKARAEKQIREKKYLFPTSQIRRAWMTCLAIFTIWNIYTIPVRIVFSGENGFQPGFDHAIFYVIDYLGDIFFLVDIWLNHRSYFFRHGILVKDQEQITKKYRGFWFWVDLVGSFPLDLFIWSTVKTHMYFRLNRFLRVFHLARYFNIWESYSSYPNILRIVKLFFSFTAIAHWIACMFFSIYVWEDFPAFDDNNWFLFTRAELSPLYDGDRGGQSLSVYHAYSRSIYWSVTMMTGQGSDPQTPRSLLEIWFALFCVIIGLVIFATAISEIWNLLKTMNEHREVINRKKDRMNNLMQQRNLPRGLKKRVWHYFEYLQSSNLGSYDDEDILRELPYHLSSEIYLFLNREIIMNVPLFSQCPATFIRTLSTRLRPVFFGPGDSIVTFGEIGREMYFISQGEVKVLSGANGELIRKMGKGEFFGEVALLSANSKRTASIVATDYVTVYMLTSEDFQDVLKDYPLIKKKISKVSSKRKVENSKKRPKIKVSLAEDEDETKENNDLDEDDLKEENKNEGDELNKSGDLNLLDLQQRRHRMLLLGPGIVQAIPLATRMQFKKNDGNPGGFPSDK